MEISEIELKGHIIDSGILTKVFDMIMDLNGDFDIREFDIGKDKTDHSYARILVKSKDKEDLEDILTAVHKLGATLPEMDNIEFKEAKRDKVVPREFYSTTNHQTYVRMNGGWVKVEDIGMDCLIVVAGNRAICKPIGDIKKGDKVIVGRKGIKVVPPERPRERSSFEFMTGKASSERPNASTIKKIAREIMMTKRDGGKMAVVGGPAIVHTGASDALAEMVRRGYVDLLLAGNALAVHDVENSLYGTSLGMEIKSGEGTVGGNKNHIYAISEILRAGSIRNAVEKGILRSGIMYECIKNDVPYVLAGSIRDDGPLPDTISDSMTAKKIMREKLKCIDMVIMMATMLHSIAVGNLLPSHVKTVNIDINPLTITKLIDRGSAQTIGIVTDVGSFLPLLASELKGVGNSS
ncbi:MAG: TIGR00300 family protein [Candidatus Methanolliviera hydrocarbonicum]|uniref:Ornithine cyclodeaminase n=1 Tax=Candidatus Methanolliviera hydrocarbonicum TaxID=2491085 RepID=A0A520KX64_9EURY|nr:MAG: TIGR00300 family protein [Candidatus Methanolliviera hydrocarbonicum]